MDLSCSLYILFNRIFTHCTSIRSFSIMKIVCRLLIALFSADFCQLKPKQIIWYVYIETIILNPSNINVSPPFTSTSSGSTYNKCSSKCFFSKWASWLPIFWYNFLQWWHCNRFKSFPECFNLRCRGKFLCVLNRTSQCGHHWFLRNFNHFHFDLEFDRFLCDSKMILLKFDGTRKI